MTTEEMIFFNEACQETRYLCPQEREYGFDDRQIYRNEISPKELIKFWKDDRIIFGLGYLEAMWEEDQNYAECIEDTFKKWKVYKAKKLLWRLEDDT